MLLSKLSDVDSKLCFFCLRAKNYLHFSSFDVTAYTILNTALRNREAWRATGHGVAESDTDEQQN